MQIKIKIPIYNSGLLVLVEKNIDTANKKLKKHDLEIDTHEDTIGICAFNPDLRMGIIWIENYDGSPECLANLHHEILHYVHVLLTHMGIDSNADNTEVQAYLLGYLSEEITKKLNASKRKPKAAKRKKKN